MALPQLLVLVGVAYYATAISISPPTFSVLQPHGLRIEEKDDGYSMVGLHFSINKPVVNVATGDYNVDLHTKTGNSFVYENPDIVVNPGDVIHYWVLCLHNGAGYQITDQSYTFPAPQPTTTTTTKAPTTHAPVTQAPVISGNNIPQGGTGSFSSGGSSSVSHSTGSTDSLHTFIDETTAHDHKNSTTSSNAYTGGSTSGSSSGTATHSGSVGSGGHLNGGFQSGGSGSSGGRIPIGATVSGGSYYGSMNGITGTQHSCASYPCIIFEDNFDILDQSVWQHEITAGGGGNWEFEYYLNNRSNSYVRDGVLYIKPTLTSDRFGEDFLRTGLLELWGNGPMDTCTANGFYGCSRQGTPEHIINPIQSARLRSSRGFSFKYGKVEVEAKLPVGDWIWPAIWMLPLRSEYGQWPASGEIDIVESRGNRHLRAPDGTSKGCDHFESTLHFGPGFAINAWKTAHVEKTLPSGSLGDQFHKYGVEWDDNSIKFFFDGQMTLNITPDQGGFWKLGHLDQLKGLDNPWRAPASKMAPFDKAFYIILNVAVGGTGGFFDDKLQGSPAKPWRDHSDFAPRDFWNQKNSWYPSWNPNERNGEDAAMKVNYVRVWKMKP